MIDRSIVIDAMEEAIAIGDRTGPVTMDDLLAIHAALMAGDDRARPGRVREEQNWIGGINPCSASFVPPPESLVPELLDAGYSVRVLVRSPDGLRDHGLGMPHRLGA